MVHRLSNKNLTKTRYNCVRPAYNYLCCVVRGGIVAFLVIDIHIISTTLKLLIHI